MTILVLGASSVIGMELAAAFAPGNRLLLVGRDRHRLEKAERFCRSKGASQVELLLADFVTEQRAVLDKALEAQVECIIHAASATSRLSDSQLDPDRLDQYAVADIVSPIGFLVDLANARPNQPIAVVFISSLLALVQSPGRRVYGSMKGIFESLLNRWATKSANRRYMVVHVGVPMSVDEPSAQSAALASATRRCFDSGKQEFFFGASGKLLYWIFLAQPLLFRALVRLLRRIRRGNQ